MTLVTWKGNHSLRNINFLILYVIVDMCESFFIMARNKRKSLQGSLLCSGLYLLTSYNERKKKRIKKGEDEPKKRKRWLKQFLKSPLQVGHAHFTCVP